MFFLNSQNWEVNGYVYFLLIQEKRYLSMIWKQKVRHTGLFGQIYGIWYSQSLQFFKMLKLMQSVYFCSDFKCPKDMRGKKGLNQN